MKPRVLVIQNGAATDDADANREQLVASLDEAIATHGPADVVLFSELATTPYFCGDNDPRWFDYAEPLDGPSVRLMQDEAKRREMHVLLPFYERGVAHDFYNSCVLIGPDGQIIPGTLPDGRVVHCYRKCHIPDTYTYTPGLNERYYFRGGPGFAVFDTVFGRVGILICYERSFPEAWRVLALGGAQMVFCPVAAYGPHRAETFLSELRTAAVQNGVFVVASNKAGPETVDAERVFGGQSAVIDPFGTVLAEAPRREGPALIAAECDLASVHEHATRLHFFRDRRPDLYGPIVHGWDAVL